MFVSRCSAETRDSSRGRRRIATGPGELAELLARVGEAITAEI